MKLHFGDRVYVDSCGVRGDEELEPDPFVVAVMDELGADLTHHRAKTFDQLEDDSFDLVVSLTPEAQHRAVGRCSVAHAWSVGPSTYPIAMYGRWPCSPTS